MFSPVRQHDRDVWYLVLCAELSWGKAYTPVSRTQQQYHTRVSMHPYYICRSIRRWYYERRQTHTPEDNRMAEHNTHSVKAEPNSMHAQPLLMCLRASLPQYQVSPACM